MCLLYKYPAGRNLPIAIWDNLYLGIKGYFRLIEYSSGKKCFAVEGGIYRDQKFFLLN